ncbi:V-set and immunoglobulin domain-containing protein 1-like [Colossoma macropomum]|uniref:V-set and immunoglobulin domain-containing protein 1-like n=1 Tax=Colossoma macropomum TaxID=42526 RepID=UPI00186494DE|nr:V-set and immunoglobulin domain-containing protein 1-like [Colossoma macropomum]
MLLTFYLLFIGLHVCEGCTLESEGKPLDITARTVESVLLPCYCTDRIPSDTFTWEKQNTKSNKWEVVSSESGQYRNRVQLVNGHSPGNLSLLISNLTEEDGGDYRCEVKGSGYTDIRLTVKGCNLEKIETTQTATAHTEESALLSCYCTDLLTKPERFTWKKLNTSTDIYEEISSESGQYRNRVQLVNGHSPGNLSLLISHLTEEDAGYYLCELTGSKRTYVKLTVEGGSTKTTVSTAITNSLQTPNSTASQTPSTHFSIVIPVLLLLGLLLLGGVVYWRYRGQRRGETESGVQKGVEGEQETQDQVTYSTVAHSNKTITPTAIHTEDMTEYASVRVN